MDTLLSAAATTVGAAFTIGLWTFRVALATRGRRIISSLIAAFEAAVFVLIFTGLIANLGDPLRLAAYAFGVGLGTLIGLLADERLSSGQSEVRVIVPGDGIEATRQLHAAGWPATSTPSVGPGGRATSVFVAVDDRRVPELLRLVDQLEPAPFVSVGRLRQTRAVPLPTGFVQVGARSRGSVSAPSPVAPVPIEPPRADPGVAIRDLRLASAELGEALADHEPSGAVAVAVAAWLVEVASRLGRELDGLPATPVILARAHAVVGRSLLSAAHVPDAAELAARARGLCDALRRPVPGAGGSGGDRS